MFNSENIGVYLNSCDILKEKFTITDVSVGNRNLYEITATDAETSQSILQQVARPATNPVTMNTVRVLTSVVELSGNLITVEIKFPESLTEQE